MLGFQAGSPGQQVAIGDVDFGLVGVIQQSHHAVVVAMRDGIEFVRVALGTADRQAQPDDARRADAVDHRVEAEFERVDAPLFVEHRVAVKARGDPIGNGGTGQHVAGELLDRELVERHPRVDRRNHPVAIRPDRTHAVFFVSVRVGVAGQIQPVPGPAFAVVRRGQQPIDEPLVGVGRPIVDERVGLFGRRREADEIE